MNAKRKLLGKIQAQPAQVRFSDACRAAGILDFMQKGGAGSHCTFAKAGEAVLLNFQNRRGFIPSYQARQLALMIDKHGDENEALPH